MADVLWCWRHARVPLAAGCCIGRTALPVQRRAAKRLAHRIRAHARRAGLAREVWVSPQQRCLATARWLRRWGWLVHVDARLMEMDFGNWEGQRWSAIAWSEVQAWEQDFLHHAPGGGEPLAALAQRAQGWAAEGSGVRTVLSHAGWINALCHVPAACDRFDAARWPAPPPPGSVSHWRALPADGRQFVARPGPGH